MGYKIHPCRSPGCSSKTEKAGAQCLPCHLRDKKARARNNRVCKGEGCSRTICRNSRSGYCRSCSAKNRTGQFASGPAPRAPCEGGCGGTYAVSNYRKTKLCRDCAARRAARSPEKRAKCASTMRRMYEDPEFRARRSEEVRAGIHRAMQDPEKMARRIENGRRLAKSEKHAANCPETIRRAVSTRAERRMAWCPPEYRDLYSELSRISGFSAAEAKAAVLRQIEADRLRISRGDLVDQETFIKVRQASAWAKERATA